MFTLLKNAFQVKDIRNRILFTLSMLIVFRIGTQITVPGVDASAITNLASTGLFSLLNTFGGGALSQYSIFAMGVSPYITASIVVQLLQMDIIPRFTEWSKQGEVGRRKLNQATKYLAVVLAFVQSIGISIGFNQLSDFGLVRNPGTTTYLMIALIMTAGSMFVIFLGDAITMNGIGNGTSLLIFSGIVARIPADLTTFYNDRFVDAGDNLTRNILFSVALAIAMLLVVIFTIYMQQAERRIPIQYSKRAAGSNQTAHLPLKINSAGVIPVIFASSFMMTPQTILGFFAANYANATWYQVLNTVFNYREPVGAIFYTILIVVFTYFYALIQINPEKMAENLQKSGGYIPSVRPGKSTEDYITSLLMRLSTVGALFLGLIALLPIIASALWNLPDSLALGGTSLLIIVGTALETTRQIEGRMVKRNYQGFIQK
ncbi:preprotein translocase subunit SecY [Jeotgalibaca sp. MA1X17-3]|uniref:preprotein translocase subunit SecY n=1 Tax=Jeotgalibaca sp. MA1X17-3 TaxID=2908211 RepID=UPI001F2C1CF1|nr:preprotein translocase subunit SecY [Jeotgalibaca sp. MA1X17-3]UJF16240.1 preprotein translocase subunit SecY [Jeotgalibaca sp. MA1X17-3]